MENSSSTHAAFGPGGRPGPAALLLLSLCLLAAAPSTLRAGGSGLNVLVVANAASSNSLDLANYYCERRNIPPSNLLRVSWTGGRVSWSPSQFNETLVQPVLQALSARGISNQVDYVVLSMDLPYRTQGGDTPNSTTSALYYGSKTNDPTTAGDACRLAPDGASVYYGSETLFREGGPTNTPGYSFLSTFITGDSLADARRFVDQGVMADGTMPTNRVILAKTSDPARNVRFRIFDNTVFDNRILGGPPLEHIVLDAFSGLTGLGGIQTGLARFDAQPGMFQPGALADSLTSFGGELFEASGQTTLLAFLLAGAAGSYGAVAEPCNYLEKFPDPLVYLYQRRGFTLAESYYQSLIAPYQGIVVGDALSAPYRRQATGGWQGLTEPALLAGQTNLSLRLTAADTNHPIQKVELFLDGVRLQTLTNITPRAGNRLRVTVNGQLATYPVPAGATLRSVTTNLGNLLRGSSFHNATQVDVWSYGDRLELQSLPANRAGSNTTLTATTERGTGSDLTVFLRAGQPVFLDTIAHGWRTFALQGTLATDDVLGVTLLKTNGESVAVSITNSPAASSLYAFMQRLLGAINNHPALRGDDGVFCQDLIGSGDVVEFNLLARSAGRATSAIQASWNVPAGFDVQPGIVKNLDERPNDLQPRNHLYVTVGTTQLDLPFALDTTTLSDGSHELRAVAYEGSSMATQTHFPIQIEVRNGTLTALLERIDGTGPNEVGVPARFRVTTQDTASRIEWFSTGGRLGSVRNQSSATFSIDGASLGAGQHQVYAVVTDTSEQTVRTPTLTVTFFRHPALVAQWSGPPRNEISWNGVAGFRYEVIASDALDGVFTVRHAVTAMNSGTFTWQDPEAAGGTGPRVRFYRVRGQP